MDGRIKLTPQELRLTAKCFREKSAQVRELLQNLKTLVNALENSWDGAVQDIFFLHYYELQPIMEQLPSALDGISLVLDNVANTFEDADNELASGMGTEGSHLGTNLNAALHDLDSSIPSTLTQIDPLLGQVCLTNPIWSLFGHQGNQTGLGFLNNASPVEGFLFGINSGLYSSLGQSTGGFSNTTGSGTSDEVITSNGFRIGGMELRPHMEHDSGFPYDPDAQRTALDVLSFMRWRMTSAAAYFIPGERDAARVYDHYLVGTGEPFRVDFQRAFSEDRGVRRGINREIARMEEAARELIREGHSPPFEIIGGFVDGGYPETTNWRRTIGRHDIFGHGRVTIDSHGNPIMHIDIHMEDVYNFNPGEVDVESGTLDEVNGRFSELGWAQEFTTYGTYSTTIALSRFHRTPTYDVINGGALGVEPLPSPHNVIIPE